MNTTINIWSVNSYPGEGLSRPWSYGGWIYKYPCSQCLSPLMLWVRLPLRAMYTTLCDKVCQWLLIDRWFFPGPPVSSTNKTDRHDITEILLKVVLSTIKQTYMINIYWGTNNIPNRILLMPDSQPLIIESPKINHIIP